MSAIFDPRIFDPRIFDTLPPPPGPQRWSDPATWTWGGGGVPTKDTDVVIPEGKFIIVDAPGAEVRELITHGDLLVVVGGFLDAWGNVVVDGPQAVLEIDGESLPGVRARVKLHPVESLFVGGGMDVIQTDTGIWTRNGGKLDIHGRPKLEWARATGPVLKGVTSVELDAEPFGLEAGDEISVVPTGHPDTDPKHHDRFEVRVVERIEGNTLHFLGPLLYDHPLVTFPDGSTWAPEVLILSRSAEVSGESDIARTHIFSGPTGGKIDRFRYCSIRYFGPRKASGFVLGRYGIHLHMEDDAQRGLVAEGIVCRDGGSHSFVAHVTHGVTWKKCIAFRVMHTPFWWDVDADDTDANPSNDIFYDRCFAAWVLKTDTDDDHQLSGFNINHGTGNRCHGCVSVGIEAGKNSSGFVWPEISISVWDFRDGLAHNCNLGVYVWQNDKEEHDIDGFVAYHCTTYGIRHGAYNNIYSWKRVRLHACGLAPLNLIATTSLNPDLRNQMWEECLFSAAGKPHCVTCFDHRSDTLRFTMVKNSRFTGHTVSAIGLNDTMDRAGMKLDFDEACVLEGNELRLINPGVHFNTELVLTTPTGRVRATKPTTPGQMNAGDDYFKSEWNASVKVLA